jgi:rRNA maturation endonuclease Nob1
MNTNVTTMSRRVAEYLVVDTAGFIKNPPLHEFGQELITLHDVIAEIRDKATKQRLQALPYELVYKEPDAEALKKGQLDLSSPWPRLTNFGIGFHTWGTEAGF